MDNPEYTRVLNDLYLCLPQDVILDIMNYIKYSKQVGQSNMQIDNLLKFNSQEKDSRMKVFNSKGNKEIIIAHIKAVIDGISMSIKSTNNNYFVMPFTFPSNTKLLKSVKSILNKEKIFAKDLILGVTHKDRFILAKIFLPTTKLTSAITLLQDENNDLLKSIFYNYDKIIGKQDYYEYFKINKWILIIDPFFKMYNDFTLGIRVDYPENDMIIFENKKEADEYINSNKKSTNKEASSEDKEFLLIKYKGNLAFKKESYKESEDFYLECLKLKPNNVDILNNLTNVYLKLRYWTKAFKYSERVLKIDGKNIKAMFRLLKSSLALNKFDECDRLIKLFENQKEEYTEVLNSKEYKEIKEFLDINRNNCKGIFDLKEMTNYMGENIDSGIKYANYTNPSVSIEFDNKRINKKDYQKIFDSPEYDNMLKETLANQYKGIKIVANKKIKKGEIIIVSKPLVIERTRKNDTENENKINLYDKIINSPEDCEEFFYLLNGFNLSSDLSERLKQKNSIENLQSYEITQIFAKNCFNIPIKVIKYNKEAEIFKNNGYKFDHIPNGRDLVLHYSGLFGYPSLFNHSCIPNALRFNIGEIFFLYAERDIDEKEEITLNYCPLQSMKDLYKERGFVCTCDSCINFSYFRDVKEYEVINSFSEALLKLGEELFYKELSKTNMIVKVFYSLKDKVHNQILISLINEFMFKILACLLRFELGWNKSINLKQIYSEFNELLDFADSLIDPINPGLCEELKILFWKIVINKNNKSYGAYKKKYDSKAKILFEDRKIFEKVVLLYESMFADYV